MPLKEIKKKWMNREGEERIFEWKEDSLVTCSGGAEWCNFAGTSELAVNHQEVGCLGARQGSRQD